MIKAILNHVYTLKDLTMFQKKKKDLTKKNYNKGQFWIMRKFMKQMHGSHNIPS